MTWHQHPFVRWLIPLLIGVALGIAIDRPTPWLTWPILILGTLLLFWLHRHPQWVLQRYLFGLVLSALFICIGYERTINHHQIHWRKHYSKKVHPNQGCWLVVKIASSPQQKGKSLRAIGQVLKIGTDAQSLSPAQGRILLYLQPQQDSASLLWGDILLVHGIFQSLAPAANPHGFDFKQYMRLRNVHFKMWVPANKWFKVAQGNPWHLRRAAMQLRLRMLQYLKQYLRQPEAFGVASALILGYRQALDEKVRTTYAEAGAMHILAVSGLHVGLILWVLQGVLNRIFFFRTYRGRWPRALLLLTVLWGFALLTGLSPSVCRAATMFSFFIIARLYHRSVFIWNILAASAFILLIIDPFLLVQPSFQLSYLALSGILAFQPHLASLWNPPSRLLHYLWSLCTVSLAAQLTTAPISMYYFHQFPTYFWLSSLIAVPAAFVLLCLGILTLVGESLVPGGGWLFGKMLSLTTDGLNEAMRAIQHLPVHSISHIWIENYTLWLLYGAIWLLAAALWQRQFRKIHYALFVAWLAAITHIAFRYHQWQQLEWIAFQVRHHTVVGIAWHGKLWLWHDGAPKKDIYFATAGYSAWKGIEKTYIYPLDAPPMQAAWGLWTGKSWVLPKGIISTYAPPTRQMPMRWVHLVHKQSSPSQTTYPLSAFILLDNTLNKYKTRQWYNYLYAAGIPWHDLKNQGSWQFK